MTNAAWRRTKAQRPIRSSKRTARPRRSYRPWLEVLEERLAPAVVTWDGGPSGTGTSFNDPVNWAGDVLPGATDDAVIGASFASVTVVASASATVNSLTTAAAFQITAGTFTIAADSVVNNPFTLSGGTLTGAGSLTLAGATSTWSAGTMSGTGTTSIPAGSVLTVSSNSSKTLSRTLRNAGTIDYTGGNLSVSATGALHNEAGATLNDTTGGDVGGSGAFHNVGTFNVSGTSVTEIDTAFHNTGVVNVLAGELQLDGGGTHAAPGSLRVNAGTTLDVNSSNAFPAGYLQINGHLRFSDGTSTVADSISTPGNLTFDTGSAATFAGAINVNALTLSGGTATFNANLTTASGSLSQATLTGSGDFSFPGTFTWFSGTLGGTGTLQVPVGATFTATGNIGKTLSRALRNFGTIDYTGGGLSVGAAGALHNEAGATLNDTNGGDINGSGPFHNVGTFNISGTSVTAIGAAFHNTGVVNVLAGELQLDGGGTHAAPGSLRVNAGTTLDVNSSNAFPAGYLQINGHLRFSDGSSTVADSISTPGNLTFDTGSAATFAGAVNVNALTLSGGTATFNGSLTAASGSLSQATLTGSGDLTLPGTFTWFSGTISGAGTLQIPVGAAFTISGSIGKTLSRALRNFGTVNYTTGGGFSIGTGGTIHNEVGATFNATGADTISGQGAFNNAGTFNRSGTGDLSISRPFHNSGVVNVHAGGLLLSGGGTSSGQFLTGAGTTLTFASVVHDLAGAAILGSGTLAFSSIGSSATPQLLEVPSRDVGAAPAAFTGGLSLDRLTLTSSRVRLVDVEDNSPGSGAEARYVNSLSVGSGSTLDLNLLPLYARQISVAGAVINGSVNPATDGGPLLLNAPSPGTIAVNGQTDAWTFFGRGGSAVTVVVNPGTTTTPAPLPPTLNFAEVRLFHPDGTQLASASGTVSGQVVTLTGVELPVDGAYRVEVRAAAAQPASVGNYFVTAWDATIDTAPLLLNQQTTGVLENQFNVDRWAFAAPAGSQVQFDLLDASSPAIRFTLTGPNGFVGFSDLTADSGLVSLPADGTYVLTASTGGNQGGAYAFRLTETRQTALVLGTPHAGTLLGTGEVQLFRVELTEGNPLLVHFASSAAGHQAEVYIRQGLPPTRRDFEYRNAEPGSSHLLTVPFAAPGTWYVLVYAATAPAPGAFTLRAVSNPLVVDGLTPNQYAADQTATLTLRGAGFVPGVQVQLIAAGGATLNAQAVALDSTTQLTADFGLTAAAPGHYDLRVTLPGGTTETLAGAFEVLSGGAANLETRVILPSALGRHANATLYIEYANTGTAAMPAPILTLQSADPDGSDRPLIALDQSQLASGFWTSASPDRFGHSVQVYASGAMPGVLLPGERVQVPVHYIGLERPWDFSDGNVEFEIRIHEAGNPDPVGWDALEDSLRPAWIAADAWGAMFDNLVAQIGPTWGDYVGMLGENAVYLSRLGQSITDVNQLYAFELLQALGLHAFPTVATALDASLAVPGLGLDFTRTFGNSITERYEVGPLGYGWSTPWELSLRREADGTVILYQSADAQRRFQPDSRRAGAYFSATGDTGVLREVAGGAHELTEVTGVVTRFRADGTLEHIREPNGNRITTEFTNGRLTTLTHSAGGSLTLSYNAAGRLVRVEDSSGRATTYTYNATDTHLLSVTDPAGTTTYTYSLGNGAAREHALRTVSDPSGLTRTFEYDDRGRLSATHLPGQAERVTIAYDNTGRITVADAAGVATRLYIDHRGAMRRAEDSLGGYVRYEYDALGQVVRTSNSLGHTQTYAWSSTGQLLGLTDAAGHTSTLTPGGPFQQPAAFTDAKGNVTRYVYDTAGNLTSATYADGTVERIAYDALGNPTTLTNRRGQPVALEYTARGQVFRETFPDGSTNVYQYDARDRLTAVVSSTQGTTTFTYDTADRLIRVDYPNNRWLEYDYDPAGRRTRMEDHDNVVVEYDYDSAGRLSELRDGGGDTLIAYTYDAAGRLSREDKGNGTFTVYGYDGAGRVERIEHRAPGGALNSQFTYDYDVLGRRTGATTPDGTWTYTYDIVGQLTRAVFASTNPAIPNQDLNYQYDALGNRVRTVLNGVTTEYVSNALNQYASVGGVAFTYDADGNLVNDGVRQYAYDVYGQLTQVVVGADTWGYEYDAFGNRTATVLNGERTEYLIDPMGLGHVVVEYAGGAVLQYVHGIGLVSRVDAGGAHYFDFDVLGSTVGVTNAAGSMVSRYAYAPFGERLLSQEGVSNPFEFVGRWGVMGEGNSLEFMRARFYLTQAGHFTSQDPLGLQAGDPNLYRYGFNSPTRFTDPSGLIALALPLLPAVVDALIAAGILASGAIAADAITQAAQDTTTPWDDVTEVDIPWDPLWDGDDTQPNMESPFRPGQPLDPGNPFNPGRGGGTTTPGTAPGLLPPGNFDPPPSPPQPPGNGGSGGGSGAPGSIDPNEKFGAAGFGDQAYITTDTFIPYRVHFENLGPGSEPTPTQPATAPAQRVEITDQLPATLDWSTLRFTEFGFGDNLHAVPAGLQYHFTTVPMTYNARTFDVEVELSFDAARGQVRAVFQSIDPGTLLPPDVLTGFLPPEDGTGIGKGHIGFTVLPRADLPSGTAIRNVALIRFDGQAVIATNQVDPQNPLDGTDPGKEALNTIDAGAPTSSVGALPATTFQTNFTVNWSGSDDAGGSGVVAYDVFVSVNGGPFMAFLTGTAQTSAVFPGAAGNTYAFYSVAIDGVGHRQPTPLGGQATVEVLSNNPPVLSPIGDRRVDEGVMLTFVVSAIDDARPGPLTFSATGLPAGASFDPLTRTFSWTPTDVQGPGVLSVTFTVSDGMAADSEAITITVNDISPPPVSPPLPTGVGLASVRQGRTTRLMARVQLSDGQVVELVSPFQRNRYRAIRAVLTGSGSSSVLFTARRLRDGKMFRRLLSV